MKAIKIEIIITDPETLDAYSDVHPEFIEDDFRSNPHTWLEDADIYIVQEDEK